MDDTRRGDDAPSRVRRGGGGRLQEQLLFLRRSLAHPFVTSALLPSPKVLGELIAANLPDIGDSFVLEIGAGTGAISNALAAAVPEEQLLLLELDAELCDWLQERFPRATVLCGNTLELDALLPPAAQDGNVAAVVSGIPATRLPLPAKHTYVDQCFGAMPPGGALLQYTFMPMPPLPCRLLGLDATRLGSTFRSPLPMFLWRFTRRQG